MTNCMNIPVEALEMNFPLRVARTGLWADSAGAGASRGGLGLEKVFEATTTDVTVAHRSERFASAPWGLFGGGPAARGRAFLVRRDGTREAVPSKKMLVLHPGDQLWEYIPGGAGWGDPLERDPDQVLARRAGPDGVDRRGPVRVRRRARRPAARPSITTRPRSVARRSGRRAGPIEWIYDRGDRGGESGRER